MKKLLSLIIGIAVLATFAGLAAADPTPAPKKPATTVNGKRKNAPLTVLSLDKNSPATHPNEATTVKGSKSNSSERVTVKHREGGDPSTSRKSPGWTEASPKSINAQRFDPYKNFKFRTGQVSQVDQKTGAFTLTAKGEQYKFTIVKDKSNKSQLPKVGEVVDVTYTGTLGGTEPAQATTVNSSKSNSSQY